MNKHDIQRARVENIKKAYPPGTRIELIGMNDGFAPFRPEREERYPLSMTSGRSILSGITAERLA